MPAPTFRLVFQGKITPDVNLAEVKSRLQKLFKKDAQTIEKLFTGRKIPIKQGLSQTQAVQYQEKMRALGALCEIEAQSDPKVESAARFSTPTTQSSPQGVKAETPSIPVRRPAKEGKALKLADIDKAFIGTIPKVDLPTSYKIGVVAVGVTMVLLPILYIGLITLFGYGVLSHAIANTAWIQSLGYKFGFLAYITPLIVGTTVIAFMIKPLFAKPARGPKTITLDPIQEPIFFHFVNKIALAVGAPRPKKIEVDCQVNASASFRQGIFSFFGDDLVLTIGMPLLAGFNSRQLAGVLAHEFGHFSQGVGMRFHYLTYKVNSWFFNAVYLRDSWDEKLEQVAEDAKDWVSIILNVARGGVWLTRKVLYVFMMAGQAVSSYMLRQMEFDADRYEAQMAGSQQFKDTTLRLQRLGVAYQVSHDHLAQAWEDKKLVNDFPLLVAHNAQQLPDELEHTLLAEMEEAKTQIYDSHPSDRERIDNAMQQQAKGIFDMLNECRDLFKRFDSLAKQVSHIYYAHVLGLEFDANKLVDVNQVVQITRQNEKQQEAYHEYFKDMAPLFEMPVSVDIFDASDTDWDDLLVQYRAVNDKIVDQIAQRRKLMKLADDSYERYQQFVAIDMLRQTGFVLFPDWFDLDEEALGKYKKLMAAAEGEWQHCMQLLKPMFELNDQRLSIALTLLNHPGISDVDKEYAQHLKTRNRLSLLVNNVKRNAESVTEFKFKHFKLAALQSCAQQIAQKNEQLPTVMNQLLEDLKQSHQQLFDALSRLDYPFVAEGEHQTMADYLEVFLPKKNQCANERDYYLSSGDILLEKLDAIYARVISGLANIALTVDKINSGEYQAEQVDTDYVAEVQDDVQRNVQQVEQETLQQEALEEPSDSNSSPDADGHQVKKTIGLESEVSVIEESKAVDETAKQAVISVDNTVQAKDEEEVQVDTADEVTGPTTDLSNKVSEEVESTTNTPEVGIETIQPETSAAEQSMPEQEQAAPIELNITANNNAGTKAVFAIDEPEEQPEAPVTKAETNEAKPVIDTGVKSVFAIDDSEETQSKDAQQPAAEQSDAQPISELAGAATFSIDETTDADTPAAKDEQVESETNSVTIVTPAVADALSVDFIVEGNETPPAGQSVKQPLAVNNDLSKDTAEQVGLSLDPPEKIETSESTKTSVELTGESSTDNSDKPSISLELASEDTASLSDASVSQPENSEATDTASESAMALSLEPIEAPAQQETPAANEEANPGDKTESLKDESVVKPQRDSMVLESKAEVLALEPIVKPDAEKKSENVDKEESIPVEDNKLELESTNNSEKSFEFNKKPSETDDKDSDSQADSLSAQAK